MEEAGDSSQEGSRWAFLARRRFWSAAGLLTLTGVVPALTAPPYSLYALQLVGWVPALWVLSRLQPAPGDGAAVAPRGMFRRLFTRALFCGWWVGFVSQCTIFYWIVPTSDTFSNLPIALSLLTLFLYGWVWGFAFAVWGALLQRLRRGSRGLWPWGLAASFVAYEFLAPQIFPYTQGVTWYQVPRVFLISTITGAYGVTFLCFACNTLILWSVEQRRTPNFGRRALLQWGAWGACVLACVVVSGVQLARIDRAEDRAESLTVALIQANQTHLDVARLEQGVPQEILGSAAAQPWVDLSEEVLAKHPEVEVLVWGEGALSLPPQACQNALNFVQRRGVALWTGAQGVEWIEPQNDQGPRYLLYNSAFALTPAATGSNQLGLAEHRKNVLLPFGEYMPFEEWIPGLDQVQTGRGLTPGDSHVFIPQKKTDILFLICYEAILTSQVRKALRDKGGLLVNVTYDAWFCDTSCPHQHLMLSAMQAAQFGMPLIRCATTGISAVVDARGVMVKTSPLFERTYLVDEVSLVDVPTFYRYYGDVFATLCGIVTLAILVLGRGAPRDSTVLPQNLVPQNSVPQN